LTCDKFYDASKGGPLFMYTGNEGSIWSFYNNSGAVFEHAEKFGALVMFPEHRFYGASLPEGPVKSYTHANVGKLLIEQAVADYAEIVRATKAADPKLGQVIAFGGSYGGMLAAFSRMWYPQWFDGALAASAPLEISLNKTSPFAFFEKITEVARASTPSGACPDAVQAAWAQGRELASAGKFTEIQAQLNLCSAPRSLGEVEDTIFMWARNAWTVMAMLNYPYATDFLGPLPAWPITAACQLMESKGKGKGTGGTGGKGGKGTDLVNSPLHALGQAAGLYYNGSQSLPCFNITEEFFVCADATGCGGARSDPNALSWDYQVCSEITLACGTNGKTDMFPSAPYSMAWIQEYCGKTWGVQPRPDWLPLRINLETESKIIFSNGELDPWSTGGIKSSVPSRDIHAIWIPLAAHHLDLRASNAADPPAVTKARVQEADIIQKWLHEA
jgi:dipeptidyl-peptidase II